MTRNLVLSRVAPVAAIVAAVAACEPERQLGLEPGTVAAINAAAVATDSALLGSFGVVSGYTNSQGYPLTPTGIIVGETDVVQVTVNGMLHLEVNPARYQIANIGPPTEPPNGRTAGPAGWPRPNPGQRVRVWLGPEGTTTPDPSQLKSVNLTPLDQFAEALSGLTAGPGQIWVERLPGPGGNVSCSGDPSICPGGNFEADDWIVLGEQTVSATRVSGPYMIASATEVVSGDTVTFSVGTTVGNIFSVGNWQWFPETQAVAIGVPQCEGSFSCAYVILDNGRMHARVEIGTDLFDLITYVVTGPGVTVGNPKVVWQVAVSVQQLTGASADVLAPRIPELVVNGLPQMGTEPEASTVNVSVTEGGNPVSDIPVSLRAEFLSGMGGHAHVTSVVDLSNPDLIASTGPDAGLPIAGHFSLSGARASQLSANTDLAGSLSGSFVAGYVSGRVRIIAEASSGADSFADTVEVTVRVPGLVDAQGLIGGVWWSGGSPAHPGSLAHYLMPGLVDPVQTIIEGMSGTILSVGDLSLPFGGAFNSDPTGPLDDPLGSEQVHATGLDVDFGLCQEISTGVASAPGGLEQPPCGAGGEVSERLLRRWAKNSGGVMRVHGNDHYHVRFVQ